MQGRLDEAAELAEQIAVEGLETGNRWAVGMMDVLLADVSLWRGRSEEAVREGRSALELFRDIGDRWGETQASAPVVRALAELGRRDESETCLERLREIVEELPAAGMRQVPNIVQSNILLQYGEPEGASNLLNTSDVSAVELGSTDYTAAYGLMQLQLGRPDDAIAVFEPEYTAAEFDGLAMSMGSRLALAYAAARRPHDALRLVTELQERAGGTYHDRLVALWAEGAAQFQLSGDGRAAVEAAHAIAITTDAVLEHALAAHARAHVLEAMHADEAEAVRTDANQQLDALGISATGWTTVFRLAL
jgi:tetratricopeptide (TPR) repeat protein